MGGHLRALASESFGSEGRCKMFNGWDPENVARLFGAENLTDEPRLLVLARHLHGDVDLSLSDNEEVTAHSCTVVERTQGVSGTQDEHIEAPGKSLQVFALYREGQWAQGQVLGDFGIGAPAAVRDGDAGPHGVQVGLCLG